MRKLLLVVCVLVVGCDKKEPPKEKDKLEEYGDKLAAEAKKVTAGAVDEAAKATRGADLATAEGKQVAIAALGDRADKLADMAAGLGDNEAQPVGKEDRCVDGKCSQTCTAGKTCNFTCSGGNCTQKCEKESNCDVTCSGANCTQSCVAGATCKFTCSGGGCTQTCDGPCKKTCSGNGCK